MTTRCLRCHIDVETTRWLPVIVFVREPGSIELWPTDARLCLPHGRNGANGMDRATYDALLAAFPTTAHERDN